MNLRHFFSFNVLALMLFTPIEGLADEVTNGGEEHDVSNTVKGSKMPARRPVLVYVLDQQYLEVVHIYGHAPFTFNIYDESGCPVMSGSSEFDADGLFNVAIDTLPSGNYTVEVVINGSVNLCSFFKM